MKPILNQNETFRQFQWFNPSGKDYKQIAADRVARGEVNYRSDFNITFVLIDINRNYTDACFREE